MNCEAYIAYYQAGEVQLYPNNIDTAFLSGIFASLPDEVGGHADFLAIQRRGDMVYYAFIAPLVGAGKDKVSIMVGLNNILITDILALTTFMKHTLSILAEEYHIARYYQELGGYLSPATDAEDIATAKAMLRDSFNKRFNDWGTPLGPTDYSQSPQTDLRTLRPDGSLSHSTLSLTQSIEGGNTLLIQLPKSDTKPTIENPPTSKPEDPKNGDSPSPTPEPKPGLNPEQGPEPGINAWWILPIIIGLLLAFYALASIPWSSRSRSTDELDSTIPAAAENHPFTQAETEKPDAAMPAPEVAEAAAAPKPDTQVSSDAAILAEGTELLYYIDNTLALFNQGQTTEYQLIEKFSNLRRFIRSIGQSGFHTLAIDYDFLNLWSKINDELWDSAIRDISPALNQECEWFNSSYNDLNEIQFLYYDESS